MWMLWKKKLVQQCKCTDPHQGDNGVQSGIREDQGKHQ
ncbi:hypothetical protein AB205_0003960 [Aquarana catesbeiana]|uniref:Uncharacterized protein n=1 Tax=Aquarana catesbeiana TaxID=8400 RepID=A0A2G9QG08_AQUCT|nr:hypothetical protein AB205_0003960 [Aquarana catesbeiana]